MGEQKISTIPMPSVPAGALWEISLAAYLRQRTDLPSLALKPLGLLDRYGEVAIGPDHMAFDGEDVPWEKAVRVVVRDLVEVVSDKAMAREAEKIRHLLPPLPGRKWVVDHAMGLLGEFAAPRLTKTRGGDVVSEVVYRGAFGRERTVQAGVFAALVMATWPEVRQSLVATARLHGVEVCGETPPRQALASAPAGYEALPRHNAAEAPTLVIPPGPAPADGPAVIVPPRQSAAGVPTLMIPPPAAAPGAAAEAAAPDAAPRAAAPDADLWTPAEPGPES